MYRNLQNIRRTPSTKKVDLIVNKNDIAGLVGPNGSGKSTMLNLISGVYKTDTGKILFQNEDIKNYHPTKYAPEA